MNKIHIENHETGQGYTYILKAITQQQIDKYPEMVPYIFAAISSLKEKRFDIKTLGYFVLSETSLVPIDIRMDVVSQMLKYDTETFYRDSPLAIPTQYRTSPLIIPSEVE